MSHTMIYEHDVTGIRIGKSRKQEKPECWSREMTIYAKTRTGDPIEIRQIMFSMDEPIGVIIDPDNTPDFEE